MTDRTGLYAMVFLGMIGSCSGAADSEKNKVKLVELEKTVGGMSAQIGTISKDVANLTLLREENVIGGSKPEKFYEFGGQRVYVEVDGKPVESYFLKRGRE